MYVDQQRWADVILALICLYFFFISFRLLFYVHYFQ